MMLKLRVALVAVAICTLALGCKDDAPDKVELVDSTKKNQNLEPNAVSEETIQALQAAIDELKSKNDTLQSQVAALQSQGSSHNAELAALGASVNEINQTAAPTRWLYDGNKVKRKKVVSVFDRLAWQEAVVEIEPGVNAHYVLGRFGDIAIDEPPMGFTNPSGNPTGLLAFETSDCSGTPYLSDGSVGGDFGQAGTIGQYVAWVTATAERKFTTINTQSSYSSTCVAGASTLPAKSSAVTLRPKSEYSYPNPLTVGP